MALINCPECGKEISDKSESCPYCGYPSKLFTNNNEQITNEEELVNQFGVTSNENNCEDENQLLDKTNSQSIVGLEPNSDSGKHKVSIILGIVAIILFVISSMYVYPRETNYKQANDQFNSGDYENSYITYLNYPEYRDSSHLAIECVQKLVNSNEIEQVLNCIYYNNYAAYNISVPENAYSQINDAMEKELINVYNKQSPSEIIGTVKNCDIILENLLPEEYGTVGDCKLICSTILPIESKNLDFRDFCTESAESLAKLLALEKTLGLNNNEICTRMLENDNLIYDFLSCNSLNRSNDLNNLTYLWYHFDYENGDSMSLNIYLNKEKRWGMFTTGMAFSKKHDKYKNATFAIKDSICYTCFNDEDIEDVAEFKITIKSYDTISIENYNTKRTYIFLKKSG